MKKSTIILIVIVIFALAVGGFFVFKSLNNKKVEPNPIIGIWKNETSIEGLEFVYTFNEEGSGIYDAAGSIMQFTYKIDGDKISILYEGDTASFDTTFSIDGDTLNIIDSNGENIPYQKVK